MPELGTFPKRLGGKGGVLRRVVSLELGSWRGGVPREGVAVGGFRT